MIIVSILVSIALLLASYTCYKEWYNRRSLKPGSVFVDYNKDPNPFSLDNVYAYIVEEVKRNVNGKLWVKCVVLKENKHNFSYKSENRHWSFLEGRRYVKKDDFHLYFSDSFIEDINKAIDDIKTEEK